MYKTKMKWSLIRVITYFVIAIFFIIAGIYLKSDFDQTIMLIAYMIFALSFVVDGIKSIIDYSQYEMLYLEEENERLDMEIKKRIEEQKNGD